MKTAVIIDENKLKKRKLRFWLFLGFFATVLVAAIVCGIILGNHILQSDYTKLQTAIKNNDIEAMLSLYKNDDLLDYDIAVTNYEKCFLGNANSNILQDGKYYECDEYSLDATDGVLSRNKNGEIETLVNESVSYINVWDNAIYYRLDNTKMCMSYIDGKSDVVIADLRIGQILIDNGKIFFVNLDDNAHLYSFDLESGEIKPIINAPIQYFAITGNKIITLSRANEFAVYDKKNGIYETGMSNVKSFAFSDKLYLSDGKNIISCSVNLRNEKKIAIGDGNLLAVIDNAVLLQKDNVIIYVADDIAYLVEKDVDICKSVILKGESLTLLIGRTSENGFDETKMNKQISEIVQEANIME